MDTEIDMPEEFVEVLREWGNALRLLHEDLSDDMIVGAYIAGLIAGTGLKVEHGTQWVKTAKGGYPRALPYAIKFPCPFGHRTQDRRDRALVQLIIEENGGWSMDPESPCPKCSWEVIRDWFIDCACCRRGEDHERHSPDHASLDVLDRYDLPDSDINYNDAGGFDASPLSFVVREFVRLWHVAGARWRIEHTEEALDVDLLVMKGADRETARNRGLASARVTLGALPTKRADARDEDRFAEPQAVADFLAELKDADGNPAVPATATTRAAWAVVKDIPATMRPSKNQVDYAQAIRNGSRATEA
jgi:hypothetical protein